MKNIRDNFGCPLLLS